MEDDFEKLCSILEAATAGVSPDYFLLPVAAENVVERMYRERVYAYELYHQLRSRWPQWRYVLGGEIDKSGHPIIRDGVLQNVKPDMAVHCPGSMADNLAVIEIKSAREEVAEVVRDLKKLTAFCHRAEYHRGVLVVFGDSHGAIAQWIDEGGPQRLDDRSVDLARIRIMCHTEPHSKGHFVL